MNDTPNDPEAAPSKSFKLADGRDARHKTYGELLDDILDRLIEKYKTGVVTQIEQDLMIIAVCIKGGQADDHPFEVVLTDEQAKSDEISVLEAKLAKAKAR